MSAETPVVASSDPRLVFRPLWAVWAGWTAVILAGAYGAASAVTWYTEGLFAGSTLARLRGFQFPLGVLDSAVGAVGLLVAALALARRRRFLLLSEIALAVVAVAVAIVAMTQHTIRTQGASWWRVEPGLWGASGVAVLWVGAATAFAVGMLLATRRAPSLRMQLRDGSPSSRVTPTFAVSAAVPIFMLIGSLGAWAKTLGISVSGLDGSNDGWVVLGAALAVWVSLAVYLSNGRRALLFVAFLFAALSSAVTVYDHQHLRGHGLVLIGWGLNLALVASFAEATAILVTAFVRQTAFTQRSGRRHGGASPIDDAVSSQRDFLATGAADLHREPTRRDEKTCPDCAEVVKAAARVCRFCGFRFNTLADT